MAAMAIKHGELVTLEELNPSSPFFKQGASVRVTGKILEGSAFLARTPRESPRISATLIVVSQAVLHKVDVMMQCQGGDAIQLTEKELIIEMMLASRKWTCCGLGDNGFVAARVKGVLCLLRRLQEYIVETAIAVVADGNATLKIDTQHLRDISFRIGSTYQFIGELLIQPDNEVLFQAILQARVGRIVDGIDLSLYHQSLQLLRQFQADHLNNSTS
ncbi:hypothetical protein POTOM_018426 [Populus tomentosa]|uniref:CST complex subunit TEN1 n=1 Tax=Populus tomentosa TaxID=118781 RepID=A0A8X7ZSA9_POPTO|nr:hypothetical protein POTOM_018426 [Populus tomentosa]